RAGAGEHEQRPRRGRDRGVLLVVQRRAEVDRRKTVRRGRGSEGEIHGGRKAKGRWPQKGAGGAKRKLEPGKAGTGCRPLLGDAAPSPRLAPNAARAPHLQKRKSRAGAGRLPRFRISVYRLLSRKPAPGPQVISATPC